MIDLSYASIQEIHQLLKERQITVRGLVLSYLSRIAKIDKCQNGLNSILEINPDALFIAETLDKKLKNVDTLPPLFGIPVLLKDNINTADRLHTSAGSVALANNYAPCDAHIVKSLRQAGAVILGKANMTEFAEYMTYGKMPHGYNSRSGQVINPYNKAKTPSGSSSGSAVAVAAGLCTVSVGTETSGSIVSPAEYNGIVGIKPTLGLVGRSGIIPLANTYDTAGPMSRTVRDAAVLLGVLAGVDQNDPATHAHDFVLPLDYTKYLDPKGLAGVRIGINRTQKLEDSDAAPEIRAAFHKLCNVISDAGAILIETPDIDYSNNSIYTIMFHEFKASMNYYLSTLNGNTEMKTLKDIIEYNQSHAPLALKYGQGVLLDAENHTSGTMTEPKYLEALVEREQAIEKLDRFFDDNNIDILLCETTNYELAAFTGFPSMSLPIGQRQDRMPINSYWVSKRFCESTLLKVTYAVEQLLKLRLKPEFVYV